MSSSEFRLVETEDGLFPVEDIELGLRASLALGYESVFPQTAIQLRGYQRAIRLAGIQLREEMI